MPIAINPINNTPSTIFMNINYDEIERGLSKNTVDGYYRDLVAFFEYVKKTYKKIEKKDITNYIMYISKDKNSKTVNRHIVSIRN